MVPEAVSPQAFATWQDTLQFIAPWTVWVLQSPSVFTQVSVVQVEAAHEGLVGVQEGGGGDVSMQVYSWV
jgi:hypothetical protein